MSEFLPWPKIPRLENEQYLFTEKIDGTNACVVINPDGSWFAQSRTRIITPESDNFGFARWCKDNERELIKLGEGRWFGEWWGQGIQRGYNQQQKKFSLFFYPGDLPTDCVNMVPSIPVSSPDECVAFLKANGSLAAPGYMRPEGAIVYHLLTRVRYKIIMDK